MTQQGRNELCRCGSGSKAKRCHDAPSAATTYRVVPVIGTGRSDRPDVWGDYSVWGYIIGDQLPTEFTIDDVGDGQPLMLTSDIPDQLVRSAPLTSLAVEPSHGTWISGSSRQTYGRSRLAFRTDVIGIPSAEAAMRRVQVEFLPRYTVALAAVCGSPVYGLVIAAHERGNIAAQWFSRSPRASVFSWGSSLHPLSTEQVKADFPRYVWATTLDAAARDSARDVDAANLQAWSRNDDLADVQALLITYYLAVERIARSVVGQARKELNISEITNKVNALERELENTDSIEKKMKSIRNAATTLQDLTSRSKSQMIMDAATLIGLSHELHDDLREFIKVRNRRLAHPAPLTGDAARDLIDWIDRAALCSNSYVHAYVKWVANRGFAVADA